MFKNISNIYVTHFVGTILKNAQAVPSPNQTFIVTKLYLEISTISHKPYIIEPYLKHLSETYK